MAHRGKQSGKHDHKESRQKGHPKENTKDFKPQAKDVTALPHYDWSGPWSEWTLDSQRRGFWYRCRRTTDGRLEYAFVQAYPKVSQWVWPPYYSGQQSRSEGSGSSYTASETSCPTCAAESEAGYATRTEDELSAIEEEGDIPAIIDVDEHNNVTVSVPDPRGGEPTIIWDEKGKGKFSAQRKIKGRSSKAKVRDWLLYVQ